MIFTQLMYLTVKPNDHVRKLIDRQIIALLEPNYSHWEDQWKQHRYFDKKIQHEFHSENT